MIKTIINKFDPFIKTIKYKRYTVYYSKGTSIISGLRRKKNQTYEPEISNRIIEILMNINDPVLVDVGANIGLMSLNILSKIPKTRVFAFEPGPHQLFLFQKTISKNKLENTIQLNDTALSYQEGYTDFVVHSTEHCSGDGFIDTGRAGVGKTIKVKTTSMDNWWKKNNYPKVDVIKIDVEGSELWVLQGAKKLISDLKPYIIMEFYPPHFEKYPFSELEVLDWFNDNNYSVYAVHSEVLLTKDNIHLNKTDLRDVYACSNVS
jgi:FkbM family methyltransferase